MTTTPSHQVARICAACVRPAGSCLLCRKVPLSVRQRGQLRLTNRGRALAGLTALGTAIVLATNVLVSAASGRSWGRDCEAPGACSDQSMNQAQNSPPWVRRGLRLR